MSSNSVYSVLPLCFDLRIQKENADEGEQNKYLQMKRKKWNENKKEIGKYNAIVESPLNLQIKRCTFCCSVCRFLADFCPRLPIFLSFLLSRFFYSFKLFSWYFVSFIPFFDQTEYWKTLNFLQIFPEKRIIFSVWTIKSLLFLINQDLWPIWENTKLKTANGKNNCNAKMSINFQWVSFDLNWKSKYF